MNRSDPLTPSRSDERGFTILEILVTVVILAILATVVTLSIRHTVSDAADAAAKEDAKVLEHAEESYRVLHGSYATEQVLVDTGILKEPSSIHDITIDPDGEYRLIRLDQSSATTTATTVPATTVPPTTAPATTTSAAPSTTVRATTTSAAPTSTAAPVTTAPAALTGVTCTFTVTSAWGSGGNGDLVVTNKSGRALSTWTVRIDRGKFELKLWNARVVSFDSSSITASNLDWNGSIKSGATATPTGGSVAGSGIAVGLSFPCTVLPNPVSAANVTCTFVVTSAWDSGGNGELRITNGNFSPLSSWTVRITRNGHTLDLWSADDESTDKTSVTASNESHNAAVAAGATSVVTGGAVGVAPVTKGMTLPCQVLDAS